MSGTSDLSRLREVAAAATPGPWTRDSGWSVTATPPEDWQGPYVVVETQHRNDAAFTEAFDPPTVLALLDQLEAAEAKVARCEALAEEAEAWNLGDVKPERMVFADDLRAALGADETREVAPVAPTGGDVAPGATEDTKGRESGAERIGGDR